MPRITSSSRSKAAGPETFWSLSGMHRPAAEGNRNFLGVSPPRRAPRRIDFVFLPLIDLRLQNKTVFL
jgi:hypothetical protein